MKTIDTTHQTTIAQLEDLTQCEDHLQFIIALLQRSQVSESIQSELKLQIEQIRQRYRDPNLYLAVVGEFSSGKSTFINALLRDDLLQASVLPTTATATKIQYGKELSTEVRLRGDPSELGSANCTGTLKTRPQSQQITVPWLGIQKMDNRQFIRAVTTQDDIVTRITAVTIFHPASFLSNGTVIIDTPGTNANCTNAQHGAVTQQVVDTRADAAIIVIPATTPLSQSLTDFLAHSLHHCLHRCIFVVTKMDAIRSREQQSLLDHIKTRLATALTLEQPTIFAASPQSVIDALNEEPIAPSLQQWQHQFTALETSLWQRLQQERVLSIAEKLLRLLTQLLSQIDVPLQAEWKRYQIKQAEIAAEIIQDLRSFTSEQYRICYRELENKATSIQTNIEHCITKHRNTVTSSIQKEISAATQTTLNDILQNKVKSILNTNQKLLQADLEKEFRNLSQAAVAIDQTFDRQFSNVYQRLQALGGNIKIDSVQTANFCQLNALDVTHSVRSIQQQFDKKDTESAGSGAVAGALIGTFFLPGVGTAIGAAVGAVIPSLFTPFEQRKTQLWETLRPNLHRQYDVSEEQTKQAFQTAVKSLALALHQRIDSYVTAYQAIVEQMLTEQQTELQRLNHLQAMLQIDLSDIQQRRELLEAQQKHVAKMSTYH